MAAEGCPFRGVLYAGLMVKGNTIKVLEFNCRLGDPETQVVLPRMRTDLIEVIEGVLMGKLGRVRSQWDPRPCVGVVMAAGGYPARYEKGHPITGLDAVDGEGVFVFHAGTRMAKDRVVTDGGRVLTVSALGKDMAQARQRVYANVRRIKFKDAQYRSDIARRAVRKSP
jgi:phosphoribosylamine--glycine ligase